MKKTTFLFALYFLSSTALFTQKMGQQTLVQLQESPAGSKVIQFIQQINSGNPLTDDDLTKLFSQRILDKFGADGMRNFILDIRETDGQLELFEANRTDKFEYDLSLKSLKNDGWLQMIMMIENESPYLLDGFRLESSESPANTETPLLSPTSEQNFTARPKKHLPENQIATKANEIAKAYENMGWFSGVVLVAKEGKPLFKKAYGYADIPNKTPNTLDTKFRIGSINKMFTAILVTQMVEKGQLYFDDKLSKFNLGFPKKIAEKITIRHLLTHTAGFADIFIPEYLGNIRAYKDIDDILPLLREEPLIYEPGEDERYSNYGYIVLGSILEKVSGQKFGDLLQRNILDKVGLKNTHYNIAEHINGEAQSYRFSVTGEKIDHTSQLEYCTPDGGMYATAADLLTYFQAFYYSEKLLSDAMKAQYAYGFQEAKKPWKKIIGNPSGGIGEAGGGPGVSAVVEQEFGGNYTIIVLANTDGQIAEEIGQRIRSVLHGRNYETPRLLPATFAYHILQEKGANYLKHNFKNELKKAGYQDYHAGILNNLGYTLLQEDKLDQAIEVFKINTQSFPKEANPFDSLAEAYLKKGDKTLALKYYKKALEIDPKFPSARKAVEELEN